VRALRPHPGSVVKIQRALSSRLSRCKLAKAGRPPTVELSEMKLAYQLLAEISDVYVVGDRAYDQTLRKV
jgi:hypothetical protein